MASHNDSKPADEQHNVAIRDRINRVVTQFTPMQHGELKEVKLHAMNRHLTTMSKIRMTPEEVQTGHADFDECPAAIQYYLLFDGDGTMEDDEMEQYLQSLIDDATANYQYYNRAGTKKRGNDFIVTGKIEFLDFIQ